MAMILNISSTQKRDIERAKEIADEFEKKE
jgi:hypothetical protein